MYERHIPADFSGAVSVSQDGRILMQKAYGFADRPNRIPNEVDTRFPTASAGKAFVAAAVMRLIRDGRLSLDTAIGDVLDFDLKRLDPGVTVRQLLNHTSGVPDYFDESVMNEYSDLFRDYPNYKIRTSKDLLPLFIDKPMAYSRGLKFQYNNSGYVLLGLMIEAVTGGPFDVYLENALFKPLKMNGTGYYELDRLPAKCAAAYIEDPQTGGWRTNIYSVDVKGTGAGGAFTTVVDVERFWTGLIRGAILPVDAFSMMTAPQTSGGNYGFGFWLRPTNGRQIPFFQGSDPGVAFVSSCDPERRSIVTVVSNRAQNVWDLHRSIRAGLNA